MFNQILGDEGKRVGKWAAIVFIILAIFLGVKTLAELKRLPSVGKEIYPQSTIMATGEGEAFAIPDVASFSFTITEASETVETAQARLDAKTASALEVLKAEGVEEKDIKTVGYNVYPKYENNQIYCITYPCPQGNPKLIGYEVSQTITVKVRDTSKAGSLVNKIGAVNVSNISGVEFTVDDREQYEAQAREQAIEKAKAEAKVLADQLGVRLGKILYYNEGGAYPYYAENAYGGDMRTSAVAPMSDKAILPQGESKIVSQVSITYEIK